MQKQLLFFIVLLCTLGFLTYSLHRIYSWMQQTRPHPINNYGKRILLTLKVAIGQTKILRRPGVGLMHALVFWGFLVITLGSIEMVVDGLTGSERFFSFTGLFYRIIIASGDVMAGVLIHLILAFLFRRLFMKIKRFGGAEMEKKSKYDAHLALLIILLLMISLLGMNSFYLALHGPEAAGSYPLSKISFETLSAWSGPSLHLGHELMWWTHILLIFLFANILPYSKHFHVFTSVPNVFLGRLDNPGTLPLMEAVNHEVKQMMDPEQAFATHAEEDVHLERLGVKDVEDVSWKNYFDALACTECGRCTSVCPAHITGKQLSPRKIYVNLRSRMKEKGPGLVKEGAKYNDNKSLLRDYITEEELWACTTCNACATECPVNIDHPSLIVDLRRYLVMEESAAPPELNSMFSFIENNGAPWQYSPEDRLKWASDLYLNSPE